MLNYRMDRIDRGKSQDMLHRELSEKVIECCLEVLKELGSGFLESVYEKALLVALSQKGLRTRAQVPLQVKFRGEIVGEFFADIMIENKLVVELKAVKALLPEHQAQVINYLKATGTDVGLLVNFGTPKLEVKRCYR
jgi:GxxExxY protein